VKDKIKSIEEKYQKEKKENEEFIIKQKLEYEKRMKELEVTMRKVFLKEKLVQII